MAKFLPAIQIITAVVLIILILLQQRGTALGSAFGGGGSFYSTRRGIQKKILWGTVISAFIFISLAIINLII